ncbi:MAG: helix-turn-helix transcriptional regulator [Rubrivivax sp.]|nr:helix-turn-helix transcriptional regulator [Rubrivivax sp.]
MDVNAHAVELQLRAAHACLRAGDAEAAVKVMQPALERMRDEGSPGYALMAGAPVLQALADELGARLPAGLAQGLADTAALAARVQRRPEGAPPTLSDKDTPAANGGSPAAGADHAANRAHGAGGANRASSADSAGSAAAAAQASGAAASAPPALPSAALEGLSAREAEVLELMARGQSNKVIARTLDISPHTVKRHVANILDKLGLESRGQAAAWWLRR